MSAVGETVGYRGGMRQFIPLVVALSGCQGGWGPYYVPCSQESVVLAPDEVSTLGFSADDAVAWFGDSAEFSARWTGRHSQSPESDRFDVQLGAIEGDVVELSHKPTRAGVSKKECAAYDFVAFNRASTIATADGGVNVEAGFTSFSMRELSLATTEVSFGGAATLSDARWDEVLVHFAAPRDSPVELYLQANAAISDYAAIVVDGDGSMSVWKCDEQLRDSQECASLDAPVLD